MKVVLIAALSENFGIGFENRLPWHLPDDFKRFKRLTSGYSVIMGRKTFESLPGVLPNRDHVIITSQQDYSVDHPSCAIVHSIEEAFNLCVTKEKVFVIGGQQIYQQTLEYADCLELTRIHKYLEADAFFPKFSLSTWEKVYSQYHPSDQQHLIDFTFETYIKK